MKKRIGFSLLELIIVMAIIGILIAIAIPSYQVYTRRAHYTEIIEATLPYRIGVEECFEITGGLEDCSAGSNGVPENRKDSNPDTLIDSIVVSPGGIITVTPKDKYGISHEDIYQLSSEIYQEQLIWQSSGKGVAQGYAN